MTTARSPLSALKAQADKIAAMLKAFERGEKIDVRFGEKIAEARDRPKIKFAIAMDDKILTVKILVGLAEYVLKQMRERGDK